MGYLTRFTLKWEPLGTPITRPNCPHSAPKNAKFCPECGVAVGRIGLDAIIAARIAASDMHYALAENGESADSCKWYEHESDVKILSKEIKDVLFTLSGEGETSGDLWRKYFLNGKMQTAKAVITFAPFRKEACNE